MSDNRGGQRPTLRLARGAALLAGGQTLALAVGNGLIALFLMILVDSALPAHASGTVVGLTLFALLLVISGGALKIAQARLVARTGATLLGALTGAAGGAVAAATFAPATSAATTRDLAVVERALDGSTVGALLGVLILPPLTLLTLALHPWLGFTLGTGALILGLMIARRLTLSSPAACAAPTTDMALLIADHGELLDALGLQARLQRGWVQAMAVSAQAQRDVADAAQRATMLAATACVATVVATLGVGAGLVIAGAVSLGSVLAVSYIAGVSVLALYRAWHAAPDAARLRAAWRRLTRAADSAPRSAMTTLPMALPAPCSQLAVADLSLCYADGGDSALAGVSFSAAAGDVVAVMGLGGSGKSSLLRALTGCWPVSGGSIRVDGASLDQWTPAMRAVHVGYRPQEPGLFAGSVANNIARFDPAISAETIIAAATDAGIHAAIQQLPGGYDHDVGRGGVRLPHSLRQRVALARALITRPFLLLLDEPHAHLDHPGEQALHAVVTSARARGAIIVIASNDQRAVDLADSLVILRDGRVVDAGPKADVWARARSNAAQPPIAAAAKRATLFAPNTPLQGEAA